MGILDALADGLFRKDVAQGFIDSANRGAVAGTFGYPVDATTGLLNAAIMGGSLLGHKSGLLRSDQMLPPITNPIGGSEWIGGLLQNAGYVSPNRNPVAESLSSVAIPASMYKVAPSVFAAEQAAAANAAKPTPLRSSSFGRQAGMLNADPLSQIAEILSAVRSSGKKGNIGLRILPEDVPTPNVGDTLRPSTTWIDGVQTDRFLNGTSSISLGRGTPADVAKAVKLSRLFHDPTTGYYPGNKLAIIGGSSSRRGQDLGEKVIKDAQVLFLTDLPMGPR